MSKASQTIRSIKRATTDLRIRPGFVVFVRGSLSSYGDALEDLWSRLQAGFLGKRFTRYRFASQTSWTVLPGPRSRSSFSELFGTGSPLAGQWELELAELGDATKDECKHTWLQLGSLAPVCGMERASHLHVLFPDDTAPATVAALGEWTINRIPLWWGSAGLVFQHTTGRLFTAHTRMAALAKRYWGVQIQDMTALQWDALHGMPSVNWLTLVGKDFAESRGMNIEAIVSEVAKLAGDGVYHRVGAHGVVLAAGPKPLRGDINTSEDIGAYLSVARLIQPLLLTHHTPLSGPFAASEVLGAWLGRFSDPQSWLDCDIATE